MNSKQNDYLLYPNLTKEVPRNTAKITEFENAVH